MNDETKKPFACSINGCEMAFTNEDHLNWHQKKHDMVLNLGLANKNNEVSDQTPTPTRFIRNCEEVGLFQDLQHVNPFDETFKKAIEAKSNNSLHTLHIPEPSSDDTLHTPHIFPPVEETSKYPPSCNNNTASEKVPNEEQSVLVIEEDNEVLEIPFLETANENNVENGEQCLEDNSGSTTADDALVDSVKISFSVCNDLKSKLKQIITRNKKSQPINVPSIQINGVLVPDSIENNKNSKIAGQEENNKSQNTTEEDDNRSKIREMNRAAQQRCRKKKQLRQKKVEFEINFLRAENAKLKLENRQIRNELAFLKATLISQNRSDKHQTSNNNNIKISEPSRSEKPAIKRLKPVKPFSLKITKPNSNTKELCEPSKSVITPKPSSVMNTNALCVVQTVPPAILPKVQSSSLILHLPNVVPSQNGTPLVINAAVPQIPTIFTSCSVPTRQAVPTSVEEESKSKKKRKV